MVVITEWFPDSPFFAAAAAAGGGGGYYSFNNQEDEGKEEEEEKVFQGASSEAKLKYPELKRKLNWTAGSRARLHNMGKTCASAQHIEYENIFCFALHPQQTHRQYFLCWGYEREKEKEREREVHPPKPRNGAQKSENAEEWRTEQGPKDCAAAAHMSKFNLSFLCSKFYPILSYPILSLPLSIHHFYVHFYCGDYSSWSCWSWHNTAASAPVLLLWLPTHQLAVAGEEEKRPQGEKEKKKKRKSGKRERIQEKRERTWKNEPFCCRELVCVGKHRVLSFPLHLPPPQFIHTARLK